MSPRLAPKYSEEHGCTISRDSGSGNGKLDKCLATYADIGKTCSRYCPLKGRGCYGQYDKCGYIARRMALASVTADMIAQYEAHLLDASESTLPARLHVEGDSNTTKRARTLSAAAGRYMDRTSQPVWTYTHSWRVVPREAWGRVSVLASCHNMADVEAATARGYACALIVTHYNSPTFKLPGGFTAVVCPSFTKGTGCATCAQSRRLCMNDTALRAKRIVVCLECHGAGANQAAQHAYNPDVDGAVK